MKALFDSARKLWALVLARKATAANGSIREGVVFHDPGSLKPHNLDDPFFDKKVQERIADVISSAAQRKSGRVG
jgi:hypothetical protein